MADESRVEPLADTVASLLQTYGASASHRSPITFEDLKVVGQGSGAAMAPTITSTASSLLSALNPRSYRQEPPKRNLLSSFNGTINPGEMVLVIGKPGSGCTTFLKTLAGLRGEFHDTQGSLLYGGKEIRENNGNSVLTTFCPEEDGHLPTLHVEETLRFAVESSWPRRSSDSSKKKAVDKLASLLGLSHVLRTRVGSASIRGVSGGERRRVSLAEAIATQADILCLDNPTNGLDSSTALEFVQMMREFTTQSRSAAVMSVYQGSDAMMPLFDKVLVINQGRQIFFGDAKAAKPYFEGLGHQCPPTTTITDFLTSMTAERIPLSIDSNTRSLPPSDVVELEEAYQTSLHYQNTLQEMKGAQKSAFPHPDFDRKAFSVPMWRQVMLCAKRQFRVLITNYYNTLIEACCMIVQSIAIGTLFRDQPRETKSFFILSCSLFFCVLVPALQAMAEFGNTFANRGLVMRQRQYGFYRPMSYALGLVMTDMLWKVVAISYNIPQYFLTGFQYDAGKFFTWFLVLYVEHMALSMIIRSLAVTSRNMSWAVLPVGVVFNMAVLYTGLYVPLPQMQVWLGWIRYANPLFYAWESIMINEFSDLEYLCSANDLAPAGPNYANIGNQVCAVLGGVPGQSTILGSEHIREQYGLDSSNLWRNLGINIALFVFFAIFTGVGMELHKPPAGKAVTVLYRKLSPERALEEPSSDSEIEKGKAYQRQSGTGGSLGYAAGDLTRMETHHGRTLMWNNLSLDIEVNGEQKRLLSDLNGFIKPRQLTALMGVSGAGKTTLLNTLAGRIEVGSIKGKMFIDGQPLPKSFRRLMGYVQQQDIHLPTQTVREALQMTARLRRPQSVSIQEKDSYVETVIDMLELEELAEALIGTPGAGLTLEQRKRVSIGVELAAHPEILFLDEPTSGLDGQSAINIVRLLKKLADSGQTVLCTIHQPAGELIESFDHLVLLVKGGRLAYDGPLGKQCSDAVEYFQKKSKIVCGENQNPAEYILDVVGAGSRSNNTFDWAEMWLADGTSLDRREQLSTLVSSEDQEPREFQSGGQYAVSILSQLPVVLRRAWLFNWRNPDYFVAKLFLNLANALLNGLTYLNSPNTVSGMYNRVFSSFMAMMVGPPLGLQTEARFVALTDIFLLRDKSAMSYSWVIMVLSAILVELPFALFTSLVFWLLWYFPVGYFTQPDRAGYAFLMYELFSVFVHSLAQLVASVMPSLESSFLANGFFFMFINTLSGTLSPKSVTPSGWSWYYSVNPLFYYGEGLTTTLTEGLEVECSQSETFTFWPPSGSTCSEYAGEWLRGATGYLLNPDSATDCHYCRYKDGQNYYQQYEWNFDNRWRDVGIFIGFIAFNYAAVMALLYITKIHRWRKV